MATVISEVEDYAKRLLKRESKGEQETTPFLYTMFDVSGSERLIV